MKYRDISLLLGLLLLLAAAACGPQPARVATVSHSERLTPSPSEPAPAATPSPVASPPPPVAPPPPLVVLRSPNGMVAAVTADGASVWAFDPGHLGIAAPVLVTSGPNLLAYGGGSVAVIDRAGIVIGHGTSTPNESLHPAPSGLSWAWTTSDSTAQPPAPQVSSLWTAGLGRNPTRVRTWTGNYTVSARQWSDAGIVVVKLGESCGGYP
jgi:hypothetical protein